jgi:hypothetical protein
MTQSETTSIPRIDWPEGGRSLYFRDPDGHALKLKTSNWSGRTF